MLQTSVQTERQSRTGTETRLHEANNKIATSQKELDQLRSTSTQHEEHCKSLQDSVSGVQAVLLKVSLPANDPSLLSLQFDRTRLSLEAERDAAIMERNIANQR